MGFAIVTDSTCDLSADEYASLNITMVPLSILVGEETFKDQVDISSQEFYERMAASETLPQTSQPTPYDFKQVYEQLAAQGADGILSVHIAGALFGTVNSARAAAEEVDIPVRVLDASAAGATASLGIVTKLACQMRDAGTSLSDTAEKVDELFHKSCFLVAPETLENLLKGGRLSADQVKTASLLNIKPIFSFDEGGVLGAFGKAKGMRGVVKAFVEEIQKHTEEQGKQCVRFCHTGNEKLVDDLKAALVDADVDYIDFGTCLCGATVATHLGAGALGVGMVAAALMEN